MWFCLSPLCLLVGQLVLDDSVGHCLIIVLGNDLIPGGPDSLAPLPLSSVALDGLIDLGLFPVPRAGLPLLSQHFQLVVACCRKAMVTHTRQRERGNKKKETERHFERERDIQREKAREERREREREKRREKDRQKRRERERER